MKSLACALALGAFLTVTGSAGAWSAPTHRAIEQLALNSLPPEYPSFVRTPDAVARILFFATEPDEERSSRDTAFRHVADEDHIFDFERVVAAGLDPATLTSFRFEFAAQFEAGRSLHADRFPVEDAARDFNHVYHWPGFLPWTVAEDFGHLQQLFSQWKTYRDYGTPAEVAATEGMIVELMGIMGHYVGDSSQPLHVTVHHHGWDCFGWKAPNPHGYSTRKDIHDWIDGKGPGGGFIGRAGITALTLASRIRPAQVLPTAPRPDGRDPVFAGFMDYVIAQNREVEPLYQLDKEGKLKADGSPGSFDGKPFIEGQILKGAQKLGDLWLTAWRQAPPDVYLRSELVQRPAKKK